MCTYVTQQSNFLSNVVNGLLNKDGKTIRVSNNNVKHQMLFIGFMMTFSRSTYSNFQIDIFFLQFVMFEYVSCTVYMYVHIFFATKSMTL